MNHFSLQDKLYTIADATFTHAKNLASFVFIYKALTSALKWLQSEKSQAHAFIAAFIGGYFVFGKNNKINEQVKRTMCFHLS